MIKLLHYNGELDEFEISYDISVGDIVYNISHGGSEHPDQFRLNDPAIMLDLHHSDYKPYECRTDLGYGPAENYFKVLRRIKKGA